MVTEKLTDEATGPRPLEVPELVELLVGGVRPLAYGTIPLTSWPCLLVAAVAEASGRTEESNSCSWQTDVGNDEVMVRNEITVRVSGGDPLPDAFDADVFSVLVAKAVAANRAADGGGYFMLGDVLSDLRLDLSDSRNYRRVSESIIKLRGLSVVSSSRVERPGRNGSLRNLMMLGVLTSYDFPSNGDFENYPVRVTWNDDAYEAIMAAPATRGAGNASEASS